MMNKSGFFISILIFCIISMNLIAWSKEDKSIQKKAGDIYDSYSADLNGDGVKEQILLKIYKVIKNESWYAKLVVLNKDGEVLWKSPESDDIDSPLVFGYNGISFMLPEVIGDIDKDGFIEIIVKRNLSDDVRPTTFEALRWKNNEFSLVKAGMLLDNPRISGNYCWSVKYDYDFLIEQKQRWIMNFISVSSDGKCTVEILDGDCFDYPYEDWVGQALITGDDVGFHIEKWIKPIPAPMENTAPIQVDELVNLLDKHYNAINNKFFEEAYNYRSNGWTGSHSYDEFYANWESNIAIGLVAAEILSQTEKKAEVKIGFYSIDSTGSEYKKAYYSGTAYLIKENGEWKIDDVQVKENM